MEEAGEVIFFVPTRCCVLGFVCQLCGWGWGQCLGGGSGAGALGPACLQAAEEALSTTMLGTAQPHLAWGFQGMQMLHGPS